MRTLANIANNVAASAGLEASFERRKQEWEHQKTLATHELEELEKQLQGAKIHKEIAQDSLKIHKKTIEQTEDIYKFHKDKFSNLGLYTWLSTTLQRLHREAYNCAYSAASLRNRLTVSSGEMNRVPFWEPAIGNPQRPGFLPGSVCLSISKTWKESSWKQITAVWKLTNLSPWSRSTRQP